MYKEDYARQFKEVARVPMPTEHGDFMCVAYEHPETGEHHEALIMGEINDGYPTLVRVHSSCFTGEVFGSKRCDCKEQLDDAQRQISQEERGVIVYLSQEGRGIGLINKLRAYALQDKGEDTVDANLKLGREQDERSYEVAAHILGLLGVERVKLLTNNPDKIIQLMGHGIEVAERVPTVFAACSDSAKYLETKKARMGHRYSTEIPGGKIE
jgi:3,4-dihydroxy 2-butanone 4-phosphate synthase/GTP cyclohydrolase II